VTAGSILYEYHTVTGDLTIARVGISEPTSISSRMNWYFMDMTGERCLMSTSFAGGNH